MPLVTGSAACLPYIYLSEILALLNEVDDQTVRFGTVSHSDELMPVGVDAQPTLSTVAPNQTMVDFYELFGEGILIEVSPWLSVLTTQMSPFQELSKWKSCMRVSRCPGQPMVLGLSLA